MSFKKIILVGWVVGGHGIGQSGYFTVLKSKRGNRDVSK
jgi:hypothetical protein